MTFSLNNILRKNKKKSSKLRVEPSSPQLLGFQSSRGSTKNKKQTSINQSFIVSFINPDFLICSRNARALLAGIHSRARYPDAGKAMACMGVVNK